MRLRPIRKSLREKHQNRHNKAKRIPSLCRCCYIKWRPMIRYQYLTISTLSINCCSQPYLPIAFPFCCTVIVLLKKSFRHIWKTIFFLRCRCHLTNLYKTRFTLPERPTCRMGYASGRAVWIGHKCRTVTTLHITGILMTVISYGS